MTSPLLGGIAEAKKGREAGSFYIIVGGGPQGRVYLADGKKRRLASPKLKSVRHIDFFGTDERAKELLPRGRFTDGDIRRALRSAELTKDPKGVENAEG